MCVLLPLVLGMFPQDVKAGPPPLLHPPGAMVPQWPPLEFFSDSDVQLQHYPAFGIDDEGTRYVVYAGRDLFCKDTICALFYQVSRDGVAWTRAVRVPGSEDFGGGPQVVGAKGGRAYIAWFGSHGLTVTWTDDQGGSFATPVAADPSLPGSLEFSIEIDSSGALHFAWDEAYNDYLYYLRSTPTYLPDASGRQSRDPVFLPGQRLFAEDGRAYSYPVMAVDGVGFVSIVYETKDRHIAFTRAYQGLTFPPSRDLGGGNDISNVQLTVAPEGPVTIFFSDENAAHKEFYLYSLVAMDGVNFQGPFKHTEGDGLFMAVRRSVRSGPDGAIYAIWYQKWPKELLSMVYAQSSDYGVTFPRRDLVQSGRDYPGASYPTLVLTQDGIRCVVTAELRYTESRR
ncbi:MAG: hypothetical protein U1E76_07515 [Planctomycetota bacterium]